MIMYINDSNNNDDNKNPTHADGAPQTSSLPQTNTSNTIISNDVYCITTCTLSATTYYNTFDNSKQYTISIILLLMIVLILYT